MLTVEAPRRAHARQPKGWPDFRQFLQGLPDVWRGAGGLLGLREAMVYILAKNTYLLPPPIFHGWLILP